MGPQPTSKPFDKKPDPYGIHHTAFMPYLKQYLEWLAVRNYSKATVNLYDKAVSYFIQWCDERSLEKPQDITRQIIERYRRHLYYYRKSNGQPLSFSTQRRRLEPIKSFFKWLTRENFILYNPASELEMPRPTKRLPQHILSPQEIDTIMNQSLVDGVLGLRNRAIIETLYSTGIRRMEAVNLKLYDVDLINGSLMVRQGKGNRDRMVPIGKRACAWIEKYLNELRPELVTGQDDGILFLTEYGEPMINNRMSDTIKKIIKASGIDKPGACHLFRHAMATHMLENGADIRIIQMILGHAKLTNTEIYTQVSIGKLKEIHQATHPARLAKDPDEEAGREALLTLLAVEEE